jgi:hypothetical protein
MTGIDDRIEQVKRIEALCAAANGEPGAPTIAPEDLVTLCSTLRDVLQWIKRHEERYPFTEKLNAPIQRAPHIEIDFKKLAEAVRDPNLTLTGAIHMLKQTFEGGR